MSRIQIKEGSSYVTSRGRDGAKLMWIFLIFVLPPLFTSLPSPKYQTLRFDPNGAKLRAFFIKPRFCIMLEIRFLIFRPHANFAPFRFDPIGLTYDGLGGFLPDIPNPIPGI
jgi:hypothetical protein